MNQFLFQLPGTFTYNGVTFLAWSGEPRFPEIDAVVLANNTVTALTVSPAVPGPGRVEIRFPFTPAPTPDQTVAHFLRQFRAVSDACAARNVQQVALSVEHLAGSQGHRADGEAKSVLRSRPRV